MISPDDINIFRIQMAACMSQINEAATLLEDACARLGDMPSHEASNATEQHIEQAIQTLKRAIEAAENSNHAGENAVIRAAAAIEDMI